jgi:hypothetical protein
MDKRTNNDLQNSAQKTKYCATHIFLEVQCQCISFVSHYVTGTHSHIILQESGGLCYT